MRPGGHRCGATFFSREHDSGYHSDMPASVPGPGGILLLGFGREKAWRNAEPIIPGPPGLCHSRTSWFHFHGSAADSLAHPDIFMVGFFVEKTGHLFSLKWSFSFSLGFGNSASPEPRAHVLQWAVDTVWGQRPSGLEPESHGMAVLAGIADTAGARGPDRRCLRDPRGG